MSDEAEAARVVADAARAMGGLDVLVNNAGVTKFIPFDNLDGATAQVWDFLYKTNVGEHVSSDCRAAYKIMEKQEKAARSSTSRPCPACCPGEAPFPTP